MKDITVKELHERMQNGDLPELIDVREVYEHEEFNIGGRNLVLGDMQQWMKEIEDLKDKEIVLYCRSGNRSGIASAFLRAQGFKNTRNLLGGMLEWKEIVDGQ